MTDFFNKAIAWVKANLIISILIGVVVLFMIGGSKMKRLFGIKRRVRHHRVARITTRRRPRIRRSLPRSVGMRKALPRTKSGRVKKPWQIKGSIAARRHMAQIRRMR